MLAGIAASSVLTSQSELWMAARAGVWGLFVGVCGQPSKNLRRAGPVMGGPTRRLVVVAGQRTENVGWAADTGCADRLRFFGDGTRLGPSTGTAMVRDISTAEGYGPWSALLASTATAQDRRSGSEAVATVVDMTRPASGERGALRRARWCPAIPVRDIAEASGLAQRTLTRRLRRLPARGVCDAAAAALMASQTSRLRLSGAVSRMCPPPIARAAHNDGSLEVRNTVSGPAGWAGLTRPMPLTRTLAVRLAVSEDSHDRATSAWSSGPDVFTRVLARDPHFRPRRAIARRRTSLPRDVAEQLACDTDPYVRADIASRDDCDQEMLIRLAKDETSWVRCYAARNPALPLDVLKALTKDSSDDVQTTAVEKWASRTGTIGEWPSAG